MREETRWFAIEHCENEIVKRVYRLVMVRRCREFIYPCGLLDMAEDRAVHDIETYERLLDAFEKTVPMIR